jgi:hypothetical protein
LLFQSLLKECASFGNRFCLIRKLGWRLMFLFILFRGGVLSRCRPESIVVGLC